MAMPQEQLLAAEFMPRRAQEGLPVMPNNGNPRTIYNTPGTGGNTPPEQISPTPTVTPQDKSPYFYPWLAPSPSVERIRQMIGTRGQMPAAPNAGPVPPQTPLLQQPQTAVLPETTAPILPSRRIY